MSDLIFGNHGAAEFHLTIEKYPSMKIPRRRITPISVPGRNGVLHIDEGTFESYIQPYECYFHDLAKSSPKVAHEIKTWLLSGEVCRRLEDTYDPECFRIATYKGPADIENTLNQYGRCRIEFDVQPEAYLKSGEKSVSFSSPDTITNPTGFDSKPLINVYGTGLGRLDINGYTAEFVKPINQVVTLDCEIMDAYRQMGEGAPEDKNSAVKIPIFPTLQPGVNNISWSGDISKIEIIPRWWTI